MDNHPQAFTLPSDAADEFRACGLVFLQPFSNLAKSYNVNGDMLFNLTVKAHLLAHILLRSGDLNPRRAWCFSGERLMLIMRRLAQSCVRGMKANDLGQKLMCKYRHGLNFELKECGRWISALELEDWLAAVAELDVVDEEP